MPVELENLLLRAIKKATTIALEELSESQNHRMIGVGRDLCGSSSPALLPKQGHLQQAAEKPALFFIGGFSQNHRITE